MYEPKPFRYDQFAKDNNLNIALSLQFEGPLTQSYRSRTASSVSDESSISQAQSELSAQPVHESLQNARPAKAESVSHFGSF